MDVRKCLLMKMSTKYRLDFYRENINYFDGMTFLFFDCRESNFIEQVSDIGFKELQIVRLADYQHMFVLNNESYDNYKYIIKSQSEIFIDSNIFGNFTSHKYEIKNEIIKLMKLKEHLGVVFNIIPFMIERSYNNFAILERDVLGIYNCYKEFFKLSDNGLSENEISIRADNALHELLNSKKNNDEIEIAQRQQNVVYAYFLKTFILYNLYNDSKDRVEKFVDFINNDVFIYMELPAEMCFNYLIYGQRSIYIDFYNKFQKSCKDILSSAKGMAWDIVLIYNTFASCSEIYRIQRIITLPYFATLDKRFAKVVRLNPVRAISYNGQGNPNLYFTRGIDDLEIDEALKSLIAQNSDERTYRFNKLDIKQLVKQYEGEVLNIIK